jgi:hypothetical protein
MSENGRKICVIGKKTAIDDKRMSKRYLLCVRTILLGGLELLGEILDHKFLLFDML